MMNPFPVVRADMRRTRSGVIAVICLVAIAVGLGVAVSAQERALRKGSARAADAFDLLIGAPGSPTQLVLSAVYLQPGSLPLIPGELLQRLAATPGVEYAAPIAFGDSHRGYPVVGSTADFVTQGGRMVLATGRVFERIFEVVVGSDVTLPLGYRFRPSHGQSRASGDEAEHVHEGLEYLVVGRMPRQGNPWDRAIIAPVEAVWWIHGLPTGHQRSTTPMVTHGPEDAEEHSEGTDEPAATHGGNRGHVGGKHEDGHEDPASLGIGPPWDEAMLPGVPGIVVKPRSVADAYRLRGMFRTSETMALFPAEVLVELYRLLGDARDLLAGIAVATQALVIAAVLLAVFTSLALRRRQLAVLRALGASRRYLFLTTWLHVSLMIGVGAAVGLVLGWGGAVILSWAFSAKTGIALPVALSSQELVMVLALVGIGCILACIPSWSSYRQPVSSALRA